MESKTVIRERGKAFRASLSDEARASMDARVLKICQNDLDWADYERVMVYLPIERQREINTWPLVRWIWANWPAVALYVPVSRGQRMTAVQITPLSDFVEDGRGIPEPKDGTELGRGENLDLIVTALLGFDRRGYRVGYGGGFYDRFLPAHGSARRIGLGYEALQIQGGVAAEPHDVRLQGVITEKKLHVF